VPVYGDAAGLPPRMPGSIRDQRLPEGPSISGMASMMLCLKNRTPRPRHLFVCALHREGQCLASTARWLTVNVWLGLKLVAKAASCCDMSDAFGYEARHLAHHSKQSWASKQGNIRGQTTILKFLTGCFGSTAAGHEGPDSNHSSLF
jgi:thiamine monophosphate kinase